MAHGLTQKEEEKYKEIHEKLWKDFQDPLLNMHISGSSSDDDDEYSKDDLCWERKISFRYKALKNVMACWKICNFKCKEIFIKHCNNVEFILVCRSIFQNK